MNKVTRVLTFSVYGVLATAAIFAVGTRFTDGPLAVFTGGPFKSGEITKAPSDWSYLKDRGEIQFQTMEPNRSRTVWLATHDQRLFIVSGYMNTRRGGIWKQWPHYLENDDRVILRIDDKLYEQRLQRIMQGPEVIPVLNELARKYFSGNEGLGTEETITSGDTWMFEVVSR